MTEILGTPTSLSMRVSRKLSDGSYGSFEVSAELEVSLAKDVNLEDSFQSLRAWLEANVGKAIKAQKAAYDQLQPAPDHERIHQYDDQTEYGIGDLRAVPPPGALKSDGPTNFPEQHDAQAPVKAPNQSPTASGAVETHEVLDKCSISHQVTGSGIHHLLVKGGKYKKYGVRLWPEKASELIESEWDAWPIGQEYDLPDGYSEAVIQMKPDGKPDRVVGLR